MDNRAYSGAIYDIIKFDLRFKGKFVLPRDIKPLFKPIYDFGFSFGKAFTARGDKTSKPDLRIIDQMIGHMTDGDIYILQANDNSRAHFGDIMAHFLSKAGVSGAVLQGWTRDSKNIENLGFNVWCKGVQPQDSSDRWGITTYLEEIVIGNIFITPKDYIFADRDAILVIKSFLVEDVLGRLQEKLDYEDDIRQAIHEGKIASEIYEEIGKW